MTEVVVAAVVVVGVVVVVVAAAVVAAVVGVGVVAVVAECCECLCPRRNATADWAESDFDDATVAAAGYGAVVVVAFDAMTTMMWSLQWWLH